DYAEMYLDIRFVPPYKVSDIESMVKETISKYPRVDYEVLSSGEPVFTDRNSPFILKFKKIAEEVLKKKVNFAREHGATDGRFFSVKGMQVLITAPYGENVHGDNEWVDVVSLVQLFEIFRRFVQEEQ
ncbi:MAG: M20/M25/M40 family metallo-hydrolase, partial [Candidatus Hydrothermae bacterium]|nr:M20/M25/M40 family metallo-hydrolase [Candidatus Hydrothermae bacterium]